MTITTRTPEGTPNSCPVCGLQLRIEPSADTLDAPCPGCGLLLWFDVQDELHRRLEYAMTIGEAARLCKVSQQTLIRCLESGDLHGFREPRSGFRQIPRRSLISFMTRHGIPVPDILK